MRFRLFLGLLMPAITISCFSANAQDTNNGYTTNKVYTSSGFDAGLFQSSVLTRPGRTNELSTIRFSYFFNLAGHLNYDINRNIGLFTGLGIKNIGFIDKIKDSTVKRRVYTVGVPLGIKIGNMEKKRYIFAGGGLDIPIHYKEKGFKKRNAKQKTSEWFSDRPSFLMPNVFAGFSVNQRFILKLQYYPTNFMNTSYTVSSPTAIIYPYAGYDVNLFYVSIGITPKVKNGSSKKKEGIPKKMS